MQRALTADAIVMIFCGTTLVGVGIIGAWLSANRFHVDVSVIVTLGFVAVFVFGAWLALEGGLIMVKGDTECTELPHSR